MDNPGTKQAGFTELHLARSTAEVELMMRAAERMGGSALILFDGREGDPEQIEAGVDAYYQEAERRAADARASVHLEMAKEPVPDIWAGSARRVLGAGGLVMSVTTEAHPRTIESIWTVMKGLQAEDIERQVAEQQG